MFKKYLYAVRVEDCEVTFLRGDDSIKMPVIVFKGDHSSPAVFANKAAAEKFCDEMQRLRDARSDRNDQFSALGKLRD